MERTISLRRGFSKPVCWLLLIYFGIVSCELLGIKVGVFKWKANIFFGGLLFLIFFLHAKVLRADKDFLRTALCCAGSMVLSAIFGYNFWVCTAFLCYFVFSYFVYFLLPSNFFYFFDPRFVLKLYFISFIPVGIFAATQVIGSLFGWVVPFVSQSIASWSRGQGFSYEPSYYALYMTPFTMFYNTKFFLQEKGQRNWKRLIGVNFLLLVSTSTGCFFSYIVFLFCLGVMRCKQIVSNTAFIKVTGYSMFSISAVLGLLWIFDPKLISQGFLKLFWAGVVEHHTFIARWKGIEEYWNIFLENPLIGAGLGGASSYYAKKQGIDIQLNDPDILEVCMASNVTTEILGSLGIVGAIAFGYFLRTVWSNCRATLRLPLNQEEKVDVLSMIVSLGVLLFTLQFNQSIMRPYVWLHIGICMGYMKWLQARYIY